MFACAHLQFNLHTLFKPGCLSVCAVLHFNLQTPFCNTALLSPSGKRRLQVPVVGTKRILEMLTVLAAWLCFAVGGFEAVVQIQECCC